MILRLLLALYFFSSIEVIENKILVKQSPMLVVDNNAVNLSCKYTYNLFSKEFRASLYKGADSAVEVCVVNGNYSHQLPFHSKTGFNCDGKLGNETVTFYLWNLFVNQTDIYFCKIEVMYPPPYIDNEKSNGTIIHVKENHPCSTPRTPESSKQLWALVVVGILAFYSFLATVILSICWLNFLLRFEDLLMTISTVKKGPLYQGCFPYAGTSCSYVNFGIKNKRNRILQSDYMNMTPRRPGPTRKHYHPYAPTRDFAAYRS